MNSINMRHIEVFLAHSSGDKAYVRAIHHLLALDGFYPWLDEFNLVAGQPWELEIEKAIERATAVVVFLSQRAVSSAGYLHKEISIALDIAQRQPEGSIAIIPIRLDSGEPPRGLRHLHWIDVSQVDRLSFNDKASYWHGRDLNVEGFMLGESYIRLRRALLHQSQQGGEFNDRMIGFYKGGYPTFQSGRYLIHGQNPNGSPYFGIAEINYHQERCEMRATIGSQEHTYIGKFDFGRLQFTGPHEVFYVQTGTNGLLVGAWDGGGLEELIPASEIAKGA
jgi:hypothetical protein